MHQAMRAIQTIGAIALDGIDQQQDFKWGGGQLMVELSAFMPVQRRKQTDCQRLLEQQ